jgi:hypothetical protein
MNNSGMRPVYKRGETDIEILDNDQPRTRAASKEPRKVRSHGLAAVGNQNPPEIGRPVKHVRIE